MRTATIVNFYELLRRRQPDTDTCSNRQIEKVVRLGGEREGEMGHLLRLLIVKRGNGGCASFVLQVHKGRK